MARPDTCCAGRPSYLGFTPGGQILVGTQQGIDPSDPAVVVFDLTTGSAGIYADWATITRYSGPPTSPWDLATLGTVFGLTLDRDGNIFVAHSSCYNGDAVGIGGAGSVYKIAAGTGVVTVFATLPNFLDTGFSASEGFPGLGNITYDCDRDQFFVTNHEDGCIYRLDASGATVQVFDPLLPDVGAPGFAPLGERLWAIQWSTNRVFYSVWHRDYFGVSAQEVRSVSLDADGAIDPITDRSEFMVPMTLSDGSSPISDMTFDTRGNLYLAERSMTNASIPAFHRSFAHYAACLNDQWLLTQPHDVGCTPQLDKSTAGGVDLDRAGWAPSQAPARIWYTGDALHYGVSPCLDVDFVYGAQGTPILGGSAVTSYLIDYNGITTGDDKTEIGDVELPCSCAEITGVKYQDLDRDGVRDGGEPLLPGWTIQSSGPLSDVDVTAADGSYRLRLGAPGTYTIAESPQAGYVPSGASSVSHELTITVPCSDETDVDFGNWLCTTLEDTCVAPPAVMRGWWPMDEPLGTLVHDIEGTADGLAGGGAPIGPGLVGNSRSFNAGQDVVISDQAGVEVGTDDFSIDLWVKTGAEVSNRRFLVDKRQQSGPNYLGYGLDIGLTGTLGFQIGDLAGNGIFASTAPALTDGEWHHVAVTVDRNSATGGLLYVDGVVVLAFDPTPYSGSLANSSNLHFASNSSGDGTGGPLFGQLDEIEIFRRVLAPAEILALAGAGQSGKCKRSAEVPAKLGFSNSQTSILMTFTICNRDWSTGSKLFSWSLAGLPASLPQCTIAGPALFTPASGVLGVSPGTCEAVTVQVERPAGLTGAQKSCYRLSVLDPTTGECFHSDGKLRANGSISFEPLQVSDLELGLDEIGVLPLGWTNLGPSALIDYRIDESDADDSTSADPALSISGNPAGTLLAGTLSLPSGVVTELQIPLLALRRIAAPEHQVRIWAALSGTTDFEQVWSVVPRSAPPTPVVSVDAAPPPRVALRVVGSPNPFRRSVSFLVALDRGGHSNISVFDIHGRRVRELQRGFLRPGAHHLEWDGHDDSGRNVGAGVYFLRLDLPGGRRESRVVKVE